MKLGRITGTVVCTRKDPSFEGVKLLLMQPLDEHGNNAGGQIAVCDSVQAGVGDLVFWEGGREAALILDDWFNPSDATIVGIVDDIEVDA